MARLIRSPHRSDRRPLLGSAIAAQLWESLREDCPGLDEAIRRGDFTGLVSWLRDNVHAHGASMAAPQLLRQVSGKPLTAAQIATP